MSKYEMYQKLEYLVELGELPSNPFSAFKINPSLFTPVVEKEANLERGFSCNAEDYVFLYRGNRITSQAIDKKYERYCRELGFFKKGNHKTRKTCLTKIADNPNINLKDAMQFSGHRDVQTYIKHYCFSRYSDEQKRNELEKTLNSVPKKECKKV